MPAVYDGTFTSAGQAIDATTTTGDPGLWSPQPSGSNWTVTGSVLTGLPAGSSPSFLVRPSGEPLPIGTSGRTLGTLIPWGGAQAIVALTPPGGWGATANAWAIALNCSMPASDPTQAVYYLCEARPSTVATQPNTLTVSKVEASTTTSLGSVSWTNDATHDYDIIFESYCERLGQPTYLFATVMDRATPPPRMSDSAHDLEFGPAGVTVLAVTDASPGLSNGMVGVPALVALPGTSGSTWARVRVYDDSPVMSLSRFGPRPIGHSWIINPDGSIVPTPATSYYPVGMVLPI